MKIMKNDNNAQIYVLEVIIVAGMLFTALYFVQGLSTSTYSSVYEPNLLMIRTDTALSALDNNPDEFYDTELTKLIITNDTTAFTSDINSKIRPCYGYTVYVYNISGMYRNSSLSLDDIKKVWYEQWSPRIGDKTLSSRSIVHDGYIYEVVMELWYL